MQFRYMYTNYVYPPIPDRRFDWFAGWVDQEGHGEHGLTEAHAIQTLLDNTDEIMTKVIFSGEWTGRAGWRSTVHFSWRSKTQLPLFMVWRQYYDDNGAVCDGRVLFSLDDRTLPKLWEYLEPVRWEFKRVWENIIWAKF